MENAKRGLGTFANDAPDRQNAAGHDAVHGVRQHDGAHHMPLAAAERESTLAVSSRHGEQALARVRHDRGEHHEREREAAGKNALLEGAELDEEQHADETEEDGRDARERFGGKADEPHDAGIFRVFGDVHRRADAERKIRTMYAARAIAEAENITVRPEEVNAEYRRLSVQQDTPEADIRRVLAPETVAAALAAQKVQRFLLDNAVVTSVMDPDKE